jgi:hypothetical protein
MNPILIVAVFCVILFFYLHVQFQLKTSSDLELFEIYETTKEGIEEICNMRQPTVFNHVDDQLVNAVIKKINMDVLNERYSQYSVQVREEAGVNNDEYATLPLAAASQLMNASSSSSGNKCFFSENNHEFLSETGVMKNISDRMLRPSLCYCADHDVMFGTEGCTTPLRFDTNYRNYYLCTKGIVYIKLVPPKYTKRLDAIYDYDLFEFRTPHNLWTSGAKVDVKSLEIALTPGKILFIPAYWWHSFQFGPSTSVVSFKYRTYMNAVATLPHSILYFLQQHNIRKKFVKPASKKEKDDNDDLLFAQKRVLTAVSTADLAKQSVSQEIKEEEASLDKEETLNKEVVLPDYAAQAEPNITHTVEEITPTDDVVVSETVVDIDETIKDVDEAVNDETVKDESVGDANKNDNDEPLIENKDENTENNEIKQMKRV